MDCKEFQEQVTPAVDKRLSAGEMKAFSDHARQCPACRNEFELESATRSFVRSRLTSTRTPRHIAERITSRIELEPSTERQTFSSKLRSFTSSIYFRPALAFAAGCLAVIFLLRDNTPGPTTATLVPGNVIHQSLANYSRVVKGEITPQQESDQPEVLAGFFGGKTTFPVYVPRMKQCKLLGGVLNEYAGLTMAHVVYKHEEGIVYVYETCWAEVQKGEKIMLPDQALASLKETGWYTETQPGGCSVVLWTRNNKTLCSAVSDIPKDKLIAYVSSVTDTP